MTRSALGNLRKWAFVKETADFPPCFFGIKGHNHVHEKIASFCMAGDFFCLVLAITLFVTVDNHVPWIWFLSSFFVFMITSIGNIWRIRWLYLPIMVILAGFSLFWSVLIASKIFYDLLLLNQPYLHRIMGHQFNVNFPPLKTDDRVQVIINVLMEFILLLPSYIGFRILSMFSLGFLFLEQENKKNRLALPFRMIDPMMNSENNSMKSE